MLTKDDIKQIRGVVKEEIGTVGKRLEKRIDGAETGLTAKINNLDKKVDKIQEDISEILTTVIDHHGKLEKRVTRIEDNLDIHSN